MAIHHFVARGVQAVVSNVPELKDGDNEPIQIHISRSGIFVLLSTVFAFVCAYTAINYTYGTLIPVLVVNEAPGTTTVIKTTRYSDETNDEDPDAPLLTKEEKEFAIPRDEEVLIIAHKPITAKFRTTLRHLREKTGSRLSRFRASTGYFLWSALYTQFALAFSSYTMHRVSLLSIPFTAALCVFSAAWVQQCVAMPGKNYFQRVAQLYRAGAFRKLFLPTMFVEAVELSVFQLPQNVMTLFDLMSPNEREVHPGVYGAVTAVTVFLTLLGITCSVIPLYIGLARYQVSLLAEEEETVIPIDRTLGTAEAKSLKAGWKSFSRRSMVTLIKTYVKLFMIQTAVFVVFVGVLAAEFHYILGDDLQKIARGMREAYRK